MYIAISLVLALLSFVIWKATSSIKLNIEHRALHIRAVLVCVTIAVVVAVNFARILKLINKVLNLSVLQSFLFYIFPTSNVSTAFYWFVTLFLALIVGVIFLALISLCYILWIKPLSKRPYYKTKNPVEKVFNYFSTWFYYKQDGFYIRESAHNIGRWLYYIRNIFGVLLLVEVVAFGVYLQMGWTFINDAFLSSFVKSLYMLPMISFYIIDQIVIFLQANPDEYEVKISTEGLQIKQTGDYSKLIKVYNSYFAGDALISYYVNDTGTMQQGISSGPDIEQLKRAKSPQLLSAVCRNVNNLVHPLSPNYIDAIIDLINGKSVVITDTYCGEFLLYYMSYLQQNLFLRRKALIIVNSHEQIEQIIEQYNQVFLKMNKIHSVWRIRDLDSMPNNSYDVDALVCTAEELFSRDAISRHTRFFKHLHDVIVLDTYNILCKEKPFVLRFFDLLKKTKVQVAFLTEENNLDIKQVLSELLQHNEISLYSNSNHNANVCIMCWRAESIYKTQQVICNTLYNDFGIGYTIAIIGSFYDVPKISMHASSATALESYAATVKEATATIREHYFGTDSIHLESIIEHNPVYAYNPQALSFDIYYDDSNNLINVVRLALSNTATTTSMVHIASKPYMLRDYFAHNMLSMYQNISGTQMIIPSITGNLRTPCIVLLIKLREDNMTCEEIIKYMAHCQVVESNIELLLKRTLDEVFGYDAYVNVYDHFSFGNIQVTTFENDNYQYSRVVKLTNNIIYTKAKAMAESVAVVIGDCEGILPINSDVIYNYCLPGQMFNYEKKRYRVESIYNGSIRLRLEESVEHEEEYTSFYDVEASSVDSKVYTAVTNDHISYEISKVNIKRTINGYFSHCNGLDFNTQNNTLEHILETPVVENKCVSVMKLAINYPFGENYSRAASLFCVLFRGLLQTVLPRNYKDIMVVSKIDIAEDTIVFEEDTNSTLRNDPIPSDWLESKDYEIPLSGKIKKLFPTLAGDYFISNNEDRINLYFVDFNEADSSAIEAFGLEIDRMLTILRDYFEWVVTNPTLSHTYLKLGYNFIPAVFDKSAVYDCLENIAVSATKTGAPLSGKLSLAELGDVEYCSFCGRPLGVAKHNFDDKRQMCNDCNKHRTDEEKEVEVLLKKAIQAMESMYNITLPSNIKVRFKTATSITKRYGSSKPSGRVLGIYNGSRREIWIERGGPEACVLSTIIHELTHAWQFENVNVDKLGLEKIEGHSTYVEIECSRELGQSLYADFWEKHILSQDDEYGRGLRYWKSYMSNESDKNIFNHIIGL